MNSVISVYMYFSKFHCHLTLHLWTNKLLLADGTVLLLLGMKMIRSRCLTVSV